MGSEVEIPGGNLVTVGYDTSAFRYVRNTGATEDSSILLSYDPKNPPPTRRILPVNYGVRVDRERIAGFLADSGFPQERIPRFSIVIAEIDHSSDPFISGSIFSRYNGNNGADQVRIFTDPLHTNRPSPSPTDALMHGIYHSLEGDVEPSKLGQQIQRLAPAALIAPMIIGSVVAYNLISRENPDPAGLLWGIEGYLMGLLLGEVSSRAPNYLNPSQRGARRFVKEKAADPRYQGLISFVSAQASA